MERKRHSQNGFSYSNLFNLESLKNFQFPRKDDDFDNCDNNSQDESRDSRGQGIGTDHDSGFISERLQGHHIRRNRKNFNDAETNSNSSARSDNYEYEAAISEERYRKMLGEHVQKYRKVKFPDSPPNLNSVRTKKSASKQSYSSKCQKMSTNANSFPAEEKMIPGMEAALEFGAGISPMRQENCYEEEFSSEYGGDCFRSYHDNSYLCINPDIQYRIPSFYEKLAVSLKLPTLLDVQIEKCYLKRTLDFGTLAAMMATDRRFGPRIQGGISDPIPQYESLQARLKALSACNSVQKFSLQVCDIGVGTSFIPEGAAGSIQRSIMSEGGTLQVYYVKVLEKGDTYEIIERRLPEKDILRKDPATIEKEEKEKIGNIWVNIVRRDIPKHHKTFINFHKKQLVDAKRCSETCQREVKLKVTRSIRLMKGAPIRTRKLARDMLVFWKRVDKEEAEIRKKEEKEAAEAMKRAEELREAKRQQQRLNFLLSQTELYSHFMQNKAQASEHVSLSEGALDIPDQIDSLEDKPAELEDPEESEMKREALKAAQDAVFKQKKITSAFDNECLKLRQAVEPDGLSNDSSIQGSSNIDLLHPSTMPVTSSVQTPEMFKGCLKGYQLKGLQWLVNCYEQGLNGILADEMGLGKTIQAMAFLAHLAEEKNIWGPFLVVAPASVLNNWVDEISRFCPDLRTLPYWGGLQERAILRKNIHPKRLYRRESGFHILITSYQLLVSDEKYFRRVKWQYMVLDEAQAIKSSNSIRWKTLLSFNCRNRLLLTGTPIQNNMAELWALLHFIMPTLFDSHEQFNEWFSKGIENHAEHGGTLNEHQLNRLHAVLKPFMLRRVKKDVITEMIGKKEVTVHCKLSSRQQAFYQAIKNKISLVELFDGSRGNLSEKRIMNLMNIVIQLRKVCNHPELFERNEGSSYFYFGQIPNSLLPPPFGELEDIYYAGSHNAITYNIPKLLHREIILNTEAPYSLCSRGFQHGAFEKLFNIFSPENVYKSVFSQDKFFKDSIGKSDTFGLIRLMNLSPSEVAFLAGSSFFERLLFDAVRWDKQSFEDLLDLLVEAECDTLKNDDFEKEKFRAVSRMLLLPRKCESNFFREKLDTGPAHDPYEALIVPQHERLVSNTRLLHSTYAFIPQARAPPINSLCSDSSFAYKVLEDFHNPWLKRLFVGFARTSEYCGPRLPSGNVHHLIQEIDSALPAEQPVLQLTYRIFGSSPPIQSFDPAKMLTDSGKLQTLDILLKRLRAENHRVLLFAQMTKMLNILEDYMNYRKYRYLRLDGSSTIMDRRDMVRDFQHRSDIFVFLLSTRAGGLGINLTAADTVIFYESDWNPTLDLQAMDRAHRLGQTKEVTVYRLICKETVEEKILQRASQKNTVQQLVMTGGHVQGDLLAPEDVVSLLLDDTQLQQKLRDTSLQAKDYEKKKNGRKAIRVDADGEVFLEDLPSIKSTSELSRKAEKTKAINKKRKYQENKHPLASQLTTQKPSRSAEAFVERNKSDSVCKEDFVGQVVELPRSKRPKRPKKSINENIEPAYYYDVSDTAKEPYPLEEHCI